MQLESNFLIKSAKNSSFGTAFAIYADVEGSYLLTAAHVVESCGVNNLLVDAFDVKRQKIVAYPSQVLHISDNAETIDLALVYVKGLLEVKPLKLSSEIREISDERHTFKIDGFRPHKGMYAKTPLSGYIRKQYTLQSKNNQTSMYDLSINQQDTIVQGYSGSAIVCSRSGLVLGIATDRNSSGKQAYATPAYYLNKIWKGLPQNDIFELENALNPYMGLESFHYENKDNYYGREKEAKEVAKIVKETKLFTLLGASGSGKSSFIFAGLVPLLEEKESKIVTFRPLDNPFKSLVSVFMPMLYDDKVKQLQKEKLLSKELENSNIDLLSLIEKCLEKENVKKLYIVIDQFEELFTLTKDKKLVNTFLNQLLGLINSQHEITLLISMRSDFLAHLSYYELINKGFNKYPTYSLALLSADNLQQVIEKPALNKGVTFEPHLLSKIIEEVENESGQLPLLQFALYQLWIHKEGSVITLNSLDKIGSISKSISQYADNIYNVNPKLQDSMKRVFINLISPGAGREDTKKVALQESFSKEDKETILLLAKKRLITTNEEEVENVREQTIDIVHESLIREWKKLKEWIDEYREFLEWEQRVNVERIFYVKNSEKKEDLLHNSKLVVAKEFLVKYHEYVTANTKNFIDKSIIKEKRDKRNRNFLFAFVFTSLVGVATGMWVLKSRADVSTKKVLSVAKKMLNYGNDVLEHKETNASSFYLSVIENFATPTNEKERKLVAKAYNNLAITFSNKNDFNKTIEYYHKAIELDPTYSGAYTSLAGHYDMNKEYEKSLYYMNKSLEINATDPRTYLVLGNTYYQKKEYEKAIEFSKKAIDIDANYTDAYVGMALAYFQTGEYDKSTKYLKKAELVGNQLDVVYALMASSYSSKKEYHKAIKFANKALDINPENSEAYTFREGAYEQLINEFTENKQYKEAISLYKKAIEEDNTHDVYFWAAFIYGAQGLDYILNNESEKAIEPLTEAIRLNPVDGQYYNNLGYAYMNMKEYDKALKFYHKALEIYANYKSLEDYPNWKTYPPKIAKYLKNKKKNGYCMTYSKLGILYFTTKKYKKAIEVYEKYLEYKPNDEKIKGYLKQARHLDK